MTRTGDAKPVDGDYATQRLARAREFKTAAENMVALGDSGGNPAISLVVTSLIAYSDTLTAKFGKGINKGSHAQIVSLLKDALGDRLPKAQENTLKRYLGQKDAVQYTTMLTTVADAQQAVEKLGDFAAWAEIEFQRYR